MRLTYYCIGEQDKAGRLPSHILANDPTPALWSLPQPGHATHLYQQTLNPRIELAQAITVHACGYRASKLATQIGKCEMPGPARPDSKRRIQVVSIIYVQDPEEDVFSTIANTRKTSHFTDGRLTLHALLLCPLPRYSLFTDGLQNVDDGRILHS